MIVEPLEAGTVGDVELASLVSHNHAADEAATLEELERMFRQLDVDFLALVSEGRATGLCSRVHLASLMSSRYGFSIFARSPAREAAVKAPLIFASTTPVREVIERSLGRHAGEFHEDVVLVNQEGALVGLIPVERLAHLQNRLVREQLQQLGNQHETLRRQNLELFQTNHALRQTQGLYWGLFHSNTVGIALLDSRGQVQAHNARLAELLNLGAGPVALASLAGLMGESDRKQFERMLVAHEHAEPSNSSAPSICELNLRVPGRGPRLFRIAAGWIRETGQVCACIDDVTEQRTLEREMVRQEKQRLLDTLVGGIAHELNNKLTPVQGFAELLVARATGETREHLALIGRSVREAARIVRQLLQLSKPEGSHAAPVDLRTIIEETLLILQFQIRESESQLDYERPGDPITVMADAGQLKQVVINLVINALQAMEGMAGPVLGVRIGRNGRGAFVSVSDTGTGIAPENLGRIFDPFFTTKGPDRGTGLGLSICFSIARQHGGDLMVDSMPGSGSRFSLQLPALAGQDASLAPDSGPAAPLPSRRGTRRCRVLVADDEPVVRILLQEMLRANFICDVDLAGTGTEALAVATRSNYDLVISDVRMPGLSGPEFYRKLREVRPALAKRFVFTTGYSGESGERQQIAQWDIPILPKPFTQTSLVEICHGHLAA